MSLTDLDQMFDLDLALTTPVTTLVDDPDRDGDSRTRTNSDVPDDLSRQVDYFPTISGDGIATASNCTVCMEGFQAEAGGKQVPCGHVFHANCIQRWLSIQNSCPLCRFSVCAAPQGCSPVS